MHPNSPAPEPADTTVTDLGPLAWVFDELRKSLDAANKALKRYAAGPGAPVDLLPRSRATAHRAQPTPPGGGRVGHGWLSGASLHGSRHGGRRTAVHQQAQRLYRCGDLQMEKAGFALVEYLEAVLNNKTVSPVALFSQYRDVQELAAGQRIHPADLWPAPHKAASVPWPQGCTHASCPVRMSGPVRPVCVACDEKPAPGGRRTSEACVGGPVCGSVSDAQRVFWSAAAAYLKPYSTGCFPVMCT